MQQQHCSSLILPEVPVVEEEKRASETDQCCCSWCSVTMDDEDVYLFPDIDPEPYLYEPEFTPEEVEQRRKEREEREKQRGQAGQSVQSRCDSNWWCLCGGCQPMPTEMKSFCCLEWDMVLPSMARDDQPDDSTCVCANPNLIAMLHPAVVDFFFRCEVNWARRPTPDGLDGQLSVE